VDDVAAAGGTVAVAGGVAVFEQPESRSMQTTAARRVHAFARAPPSLAVGCERMDEWRRDADT
jgi:hypothetical protein